MVVVAVSIHGWGLDRALLEAAVAVDLAAAADLERDQRWSVMIHLQIAPNNRDRRRHRWRSGVSLFPTANSHDYSSSFLLLG